MNSNDHRRISDSIARVEGAWTILELFKSDFKERLIESKFSTTQEDRDLLRKFEDDLLTARVTWNNLRESIRGGVK